MNTIQPRIAQAGDLDNLTRWIAGPLGSAWLRLYATDVPFDPANTPADYVEASFPGYVPINPVSWGTPFLNSDGKAETDSGTMEFTYPGKTGHYTVYGLYLTDVGLTKLFAVWPFLAPFVFSGKQQSLPLTLSLTAVSELLA